MKIRIESGPCSGKTFQLSHGKEYSIGREKGDIRLNAEAACSDPHARLLVKNGTWHVIDEMTAEGTIVNDRPANYAELREGTTITIGATVLRVISVATTENATETTRQHTQTSGHAPAPVPVLTTSTPRAPVAARSQPTHQPQGQRSKAPNPLPRQTGSNMTLVAAVIGLLILGILAFVVFTGPKGGATTDDVPRTAQVDSKQAAIADFVRRIEAAEAKSDHYLRLAALFDLKKQSVGVGLPPKTLDRLDKSYNDTLKRYAATVDLETRPALVHARTALEKGNYKTAMGLLVDARAKFSEGDEVWSTALAYTGNEAAIANLTREVLALNEGLVQREFQVAKSLEVVGWWSEAASVYSELLNKAWFAPEDQAFVEAKINDYRSRPVSDYVSRFANGTGWSKQDLEDAASDGKAPEDPPQAGSDEPGVVSVAQPAVRKIDFAPFPHDLTTHLSNYLATLLPIATESLAVGGLRFEIEGKQWKAESVDLAGWRLSRNQDTHFLAWPETPEAQLLQLAKRLPASVENDAGLAVLLAFGGRLEGSSRVVFASARRQPELAEKAQAFLAHLLGIAVPEGGFAVLDDRYVTPETIEAIELQRKVDQLIALFVRGLGKRETLKARKNSDAAFEEIVGIGEAAAKPAVAVLMKAREEAIEKLEKSTGLASRDTATLKQLREELIKRRKHALELIFDEVKWPYPYGPNNGEVTLEVMKRVEAVREIWDNPLQAVGRASPKIQDTIEFVRQVNERLMRVDPLNQFHESSGLEDMEYMASLANKALNIKNFAVTSKEKSDFAKWGAIMEENAKRREASSGNEKAPDDEAWEQLRITNDYRMMMGIHPLKMNDKLFWAARHHSQWCVEVNGGQISHDSPGGKRGANPSQRTAFEGYNYGVGENIHMSNSPTPMSSHLSWLTSSGHHRNILSSSWTVMGNARFGTIWTQNFGSVDEGKGNTESKGGA